jgi:hypothetical protein
MKNDEHDPRLPVVSLHFREEVLAAEYRKIRALQGTKATYGVQRALTSRGGEGTPSHRFRSQGQKVTVFSALTPLSPPPQVVDVTSTPSFCTLSQRHLDKGAISS